MFPARKLKPHINPTQTEIPTMNRRPLVLLALVVASFVASACSSVTAPTSKDNCSGYIDSSGRCVAGDTK
jgi:hypothetical protein